MMSKKLGRNGSVVTGTKTAVSGSPMSVRASSRPSRQKREAVGRRTLASDVRCPRLAWSGDPPLAGTGACHQGACLAYAGTALITYGPTPFDTVEHGRYLGGGKR